MLVSVIVISSYSKINGIVTARGQEFMAVNQPKPKDKGGLRCHKCLATVL